jgi:hypothetical protein
MNDRKYCDECAHCTVKDAEDPRFSTCALTADQNIYSPVSRKCSVERYCATARTQGQPCGPDAKFYQPKEAAV